MKILNCSIARNVKRKATKAVARCRRLGLLVPLAAAIYASAATATNVPITFEAPTYSLGPVAGQDGWAGAFGLPNSTVTVSNSSPIQGLRSLRVAGNGDNQFAKSGVFSVPVPTDMSWLVRVDSLGTGKFEAGLINGPADVSPLAIGFQTNGLLTYYDGTLDSNFPGNPTYSVGTVYRVELHNISTVSNTFDASIFNNGTSALVASMTGSAHTPFVAGGIGLYAFHPGDAAGVALIDNITASVVPEPSLVVLLCLGALGLPWVGHRRLRWR